MSESIALNGTKKNLKTVIENLEKIKDQEHYLRVNVDILNNKVWDMELEKLKKLKEEIDKCLEIFENSTTVEMVRGKLCKRKKKRRWLQKRRKQKKLLDEENEVNRKKLHERIDQSLKIKRFEYMRAHLQNETKKYSKNILNCICQKKKNAINNLLLFDSIKKFRKLKKKNTQKSTKDDDYFIEVMKKLKSLWNNALNDYEREENDIKLKVNDILKTIGEQWDEILFGEKDSQRAVPEVLHSLHDFLDIRNIWDSYLVPYDSNFGSSIPIGWVMPNENPSEHWAVYRCNENNFK